jgi:hypothetical protein
MGWDGQTRRLQSSDKFTYSLEEYKDDGMMIRQDVCAQVTSSRTFWRRAKMMGRGDQTRCLRSSDKFMYALEGGRDNGMG